MCGSIKNVLGQYESPYELLVANIINTVGCLLSLHILHNHLNFFPENLGKQGNDFIST